MKMGSGATKKAERVERKKKKLNALLEITKLNDKDRIKENPNCCVEEVQNLRNEEEKEDGEIEDNSVLPDGPRRKKHKTNDGSVALYHHESKEGLKDNKSSDIIQTNSTQFIPADELIKLRKELREKRNKLKGGNYASYDNWSYRKPYTHIPVSNRNGYRNNHFGFFRNATPRVLVNEMGEKALLERNYRTPLFICDIQHVILHTQLGTLSPARPRWCSFERQGKISHTVVFVVEGATVYDYISSESKYAMLPKMQKHVEVVSPLNYDGNLVEELATVPLSRTQKDKLERKYGSLRQAELNSGVVFRILRSIFPIELPPVHTSNHKSLPACDRFPRTELLLSAWQMIEEGYPIPVKGELQDRYAEYKMSREKYAEVTPLSPMWGLDCEMCLTSIGQNELTRVSIVDENHKVVYESLVKPPNKIINYLTQYSGITKDMMKDITKTLENVQQDLHNLLPPDVILVGQSLNFDLHALKIMHPYVIDTSIIYNLSGIRPRKTKLSILAEKFLGEQIQTGHGHDSVEDSSSSLKLVQLKLANSVEFGDAVLLGSSISYTPKQNVGPPVKCEEVFATSLFSYVTKNKNTAAVVGKDEVMSHYRPLAMIPLLNESSNCESRVKCQAVQTNDEAVMFTCNEALYHSFLMTHIKLEDDESLIDVDRWCSQICNSLAHNAFFITILAGRPYNKSHGACFLHIKSAYSNNNSHTSRYNPV